MSNVRPHRNRLLLLMGRKFNPFELELYRVTDEVLHYEWDPIGVSREPMARDEYHAYLPQVFALLQEEQGSERLAQYLVGIERERMGLAADLEHARETAALLIAWQTVIKNKHAALPVPSRE